MLSFGSTKSHKSSGSQPKIDLRETSAEKERGRLQGKNDPTLAVNEEEPCKKFPGLLRGPSAEKAESADGDPAAVANNHTNNLQSLRDTQYRDANGNLIGT